MIPATKALYSNKILATAIQLFAIPQKSLKDLGGFESFVYEYERDGGSYILKITHTVRRSVDYLMGELDFVNYLQANGVATAEAIPSINNQFIEEIADGQGGAFLVYAFRKLPGGKIDINTWNEKTFYELGKTTGLMHALAKKYQPAKAAYTRQNWYEDEVLKFDKHIPANETKIITIAYDILNSVKALPQTAATYGLVHGDLHYGNFFMDKEQLYVFDFDDCEQHYYEADVGISLYYMQYHPLQKQSKKEFADWFLPNYLAGYHCHNTLVKGWEDNIPKFLALREVLLYSLFCQIWDLNNLDEKQTETLEKYRKSILANAIYNHEA